MKLLELKKKKPEELEKLLLESKKELFNLRSSSLAGEDAQKKKARIKVVKRDVSRILTILNENN